PTDCVNRQALPIAIDQVSSARPKWPDREVYFDAHETIIEEIRSVLCDGSMTNGRRVAALEAQLAAQTGAKHCVAVASGTMGLTLALRAAGIKGRLIAPALGFPATLLAGMWNGLVVHLLPVDSS